MRLGVSAITLRAAAVVGLAVGLAGCGLDDAKVPELSGPAELGLSFFLDARPDVVTANGYSTVSLQATLRNQNGQPAGRCSSAIADATGTFADIGRLNSTTAVTGSNGVAQVIYTSPPRTDQTAHGSVLVTARPIGGDANGQVYRTVRIELRSAEPRLFPPNPANCIQSPNSRPRRGGAAPRRGGTVRQAVPLPVHVDGLARRHRQGGQDRAVLLGLR